MRKMRVICLMERNVFGRRMMASGQWPMSMWRVWHFTSIQFAHWMWMGHFGHFDQVYSCCCCLDMLWISTNTKWPRQGKWKIWHFKHLRSGSGLETWDHGRWQYKVPSPHEQIKQQSRERHRNVSAPCSRQAKVLYFLQKPNKVAFGCCPCNRAHRGS